MPAMSKLRFAAVFALAVGGAVSWASSEQDPLNALATEDACAADDEACTLSMLQIRTVEQYEIKGPKDEDDEDEDEDEESSTKAAKKSKKKISSKSDDEDEEDEDEDEDDEDAEGDEDDDFYGDEDVNDEEEKKGPFCCQHGQGMGSANDNDEGATCYPSSKPELMDFCDNKAICQNDCNGTWLIGFCALETVDGKTADGKDPCGLELNEVETGYDYTGDGSRAVMEETCAQSAEVCGGLGCNGTWCQYVKTPIY